MALSIPFNVIILIISLLAANYSSIYGFYFNSIVIDIRSKGLGMKIKLENDPSLANWAKKIVA
jgi:hypothetical protein